MNQSRLRLKKKERTLLLESNIINEYPWLKKALEENERLTEEVVNSFDKEKINFIDNILPQVLKQSVSEWEGDAGFPVDDLGTDNDDWIKCSLCGTKNRWIFYIENKFNNNKLNVGSECIKEFGINVERSGMSREQLIKNATKIMLTNKLNNVFPGISRQVTEWNYKLDHYQIILPAFLENKYIALGERAKVLFGSYIEQKTKDGVIEEFNEIFEKQESIINEIEKYVSKNSPKKNIPAKAIEKWLLSKGDQNSKETIKMLKEDGLITWRTAHRLEEPQYMQSLIPRFNHFLKDHGLEIEKIDTDRRGYVFTPSGKGNIHLLLRHNIFVLDFGGLIFGEDLDFPLTAEKLISEYSKIYDEKTYYLILDELQSLTKYSNITFMDFNFEFNEIKIHENQDDMYLIANFKELMEKFKGLATGMVKQRAGEIEEFIKKLPNKRYTKDDLKKYEIPKWLYKNI